MNTPRSWKMALWRIANWSKPTAFLSQEFLYKKPLFVLTLQKMKTAAPEQILIGITQTNSPGLHCYDQHDLQLRLSETHWAAEVMKGNLWLWIMSEKPKMAARLFGTGQAPVQTHLCLPSDCLLGVESTRTATTPITVRKTIHKDPCLQTTYLKNSVTWPSLHEKGMG